MSVSEEIDSNILEEIVQHLKSSTCYLDSLPTSFSKSVLKCLEADLLEVVNTSLLSWTLTNPLKTAVIKPLLKKQSYFQYFHTFRSYLEAIRYYVSIGEHKSKWMSMTYAVP